jgi:hypothetical protein
MTLSLALLLLTARPLLFLAWSLAAVAAAGF